MGFERSNNTRPVNPPSRPPTLGGGVFPLRCDCIIEASATFGGGGCVSDLLVVDRRLSAFRVSAKTVSAASAPPGLRETPVAC